MKDKVQSRGGISVSEPINYEKAYASSFDDASNANLRQTAIPFGLNRWIYLILSAIIVVLFGPLVMNWGELQELLEKEGAYKWLCDGTNTNRIFSPSDNNCPEQDELIGQMGILAEDLFFVGAFVGGVIFDQFGPRISAILGGIGFSLSYLMLAISSSTRRTYFAFALIQGFSVEFAFYAVITIPNLFPKHRGLTLAGIGTARSIAMLGSLLFNRVRTDKYNANKIGWTFFGISLAITIFGGIILPDQAFKVTDDDGNVIPLECDDPGGQPQSAMKRYKTWFYTIGHPFYIFWVICYALLFSRAQFHIISLKSQHRRVASAFGYLAGLSFVYCPVLGYLVDTIGAIPTVFGLNVMGIVAYICLISGDALAAQWIAVLCLMVLLSFLGSENYVTIQERYSERYAGKLCGLVTCLGGLFSLTNTAIWNWAKLNSQFKKADGIYLGYSAVCVILLGVLWYGPPWLFRNPCFPNAPNASLSKGKGKKEMDKYGGNDVSHQQT